MRSWNRLSIGDHMRSWGKTQVCMRCGEPSIVRRLLTDQASHGWTDTLNFLHRGGRNLMDHILFCMVFQTVVHYL
ncbi:LOW QUALITY PROTEIN: hypothetical protein HID58_034199 [Brassica napus]|uniref:Uncharacterized protein n=1 Tax=Brassica napus TaxID=3708 RepID=A0ABQ8C1M4_BRANA|nr:LOW QUALITY PROTEIN: hypothetical protein HID58_034199 [Brassica napus]